jgi:hypothetical protein
VPGTPAKPTSVSTKKPKTTTAKSATSSNPSQKGEQRSVEERLSIIEDCMRNFRLSYKAPDSDTTTPLELVLDDVITRIVNLEKRKK